MALNRIELLTLLAILRLGEKAYGVTIYDEIQRIAGSDVSMAGVYSAVDRLERRGLVTFEGRHRARITDMAGLTRLLAAT